MAEKKINTNFLWIILVLATAVVVFTITYKLGVIRDVIPETHADLISVVSLLFFLIVLILYVPTTGKKRKKTRMVEVTPISNSEEIVFSQITEEDEEYLGDHDRSGESTGSTASSASMQMDLSSPSFSRGKFAGVPAGSSGLPGIDESGDSSDLPSRVLVEEDETKILEFRFPFHPDKDVYAETTIDVGKGRSLTLLCEMT